MPAVQTNTMVHRLTKIIFTFFFKEIKFQNGKMFVFL